MPSLDLETGEEVYDVETIANSQRVTKAKGEVEYLVKWLDYSEEKNTWEPEASFDNPWVQDLIDAFHTKHPNAYHPGGGAGH